MEYTKYQKGLMYGMKMLGISTDAAVAVMHLLNTDEKAKQMMFWLKANQQSTEDEIVIKATKFSPEMNLLNKE